MTWQFWMLQMHYYAIMLFLLVHLCWCLSRSLVFTIPFARTAKNALVVWPVAKMKMNFTSWRFFVRAVVRRIFQNWKFCASLRTHDNSLNVFAYRIYDFFWSLVIHCVGLECLCICRTSTKNHWPVRQEMPLSRQVFDLWFVNLWIVNCRLPVHVQLHQLLIWMSMGPLGHMYSRYSSGVWLFDCLYHGICGFAP